MVARFGLATHVSVDAGGLQSRRDRRAQQEMVEPEARVPGPPVPQMAPERKHWIVRTERPQGVGPASSQELRIGRARRWLKQRVVFV
jgi:hypothetical protein